MEFSRQTEDRLRRAFKTFNRLMLLFWRLGWGKLVNIAPASIGQIMVVSHIGRKSGRVRRTPVNYFIRGDEIYCTAGFGAVSDWYRNIRKNPRVEVWLPEGWWQGIAEDVSDHPERLELMRRVLIASGFAAKTIGLQPATMTAADLEGLTKTYKLIRIRRGAACTGAGGPGDLAWIWPLATFALLPLALGKRRRGG